MQRRSSKMFRGGPTIRAIIALADLSVPSVELEIIQGTEEPGLVLGGRRFIGRGNGVTPGRHVLYGKCPYSRLNARPQEARVVGLERDMQKSLLITGVALGFIVLDAISLISVQKGAIMAQQSRSQVHAPEF